MDYVNEAMKRMQKGDVKVCVCVGPGLGWDGVGWGARGVGGGGIAVILLGRWKNAGSGEIACAPVLKLEG